MPSSVRTQHAAFALTVAFAVRLLFLLVAVPMLGHIGDGNVHCVFLLDPRDEQAFKLAESYSLAVGE